jgi:FKBP-type peptidyl-prolyl cis-trans isomerase FklB
MRLRIPAAATAFGLVLTGQAFAGDISRQANEEYLAANAKNPAFVKLPSGLRYRIIKSGSGQTPTADDTVTVAYKGTLVDGYVFEETKAGETKNLPAGKVVPGWKEALSLMKEGDEWEIVIPSELAYGAARTEAIPSNQVLTFDMQLVAVVRSRR